MRINEGSIIIELGHHTMVRYYQFVLSLWTPPPALMLCNLLLSDILMNGILFLDIRKYRNSDYKPWKVDQVYHWWQFSATTDWTYQ